jgi:hypothetical protein
MRGFRAARHWFSMTKDPHLSQHDLERYHLGMVKDEVELAPL